MDETLKQNHPTPIEQSARKRKKVLGESSLSSDEDENDIHFARFFVISATDGQPIKYNIFAIQKFIQCGVGDVKIAKKLQNGTVLLEVTSKEQAKKATAMNNWFDTPITVTPHRSLNSSRGVLRCREFRDCTDDEVLSALRSQGVTSVKHIMTKRNDKLEPTNTFILSFNMPIPPKVLKAAYLKLDVELYIPNPLRCYKCQKFGHGRNSCNRTAVCAKCGQEGHEDTSCQAPLHCVNCSGSHAAFSKDCPTWVKQRDITQVKCEKNVSFFEARKIVEQRATNSAGPTGAPGAKRAGVSYASATIVQTRAATTQTDLTWPLDSKVPVAVCNVLPRKAVISCQSQTETAEGTMKKPDGGTPPKHVKKNVSNIPQKPRPASKMKPNRERKGANDPVGNFNRFGSLEDDDGMEFETTRTKPSSPKGKK